MNKLLKVTVLLLTVMSCNTFAFSYSPTGCYAPTKPYKFTHQYQIDSYNRGVEDYQRCINTYIEVRKEEVETAIREWNNFVKYN